MWSAELKVLEATVSAQVTRLGEMDVEIAGLTEQVPKSLSSLQECSQRVLSAEAGLHQEDDNKAEAAEGQSSTKNAKKSARQESS